MTVDRGEEQGGLNWIGIRGNHDSRKRNLPILVIPGLLTPHIQVMETENHYYLVLEMVRGGDLMTHICNNKRLSEQEAQKYTRQIISAVEYLHGLGIVHRFGSFYPVRKDSQI